MLSRRRSRLSRSGVAPDGPPEVPMSSRWRLRAEHAEKSEKNNAIPGELRGPPYGGGSPRNASRRTGAAASLRDRGSTHAAATLQQRTDRICRSLPATCPAVSLWFSIHAPPHALPCPTRRVARLRTRATASTRARGRRAPHASVIHTHRSATSNIPSHPTHVHTCDAPRPPPRLCSVHSVHALHARPRNFDHSSVEPSGHEGCEYAILMELDPK